MKTLHRVITLTTDAGTALHDVTPAVRALVADSGIREGLVTLTSRHTTTAVAINENEDRLLEDVRRFLARLVPADRHYLHNDIHLRDCPPDEPENAHAHILAMLLGASETIAVVDGAPDLGRWQSVLLVELDGPRTRTLSLRAWGDA
ncbi:MAG: secondary thiamine-phosphate synthase enzyme YjbQ [Chromatiales bacterium]|jgi:secondary thiamine-phosphate synthase enzyme